MQKSTEIRYVRSILTFLPEFTEKYVPDFNTETLHNPWGISIAFCFRNSLEFLVSY